MKNRIAPRVFYQEHLDTAQTAHIALLRRISLLGWLRTLVVVLTGCGIWLLIRQDEGLWWLAALPGAIVFLLLLNYHNHIRRREWECRVQIQVLEEELKTLDGNFSHHPVGSEHVDPLHPFSYDLDIFGKGSVYQLLCRTVTLQGAGTLAQLLKEPYAADARVCTDRQAVLQELSTHPDFLLRYRVAGRSAPEAAGDFDKIINWLNQPDLFNGRRTAHLLSWICPAITIAAIALSVWHGGWHPVLGLSIALNWGVLLIFRKKTSAGFYFSGKLAGFISKYEGTFRATAKMSFIHPSLQATVETAQQAAKGIPALKKLVQRIENRQNPFVGPLMNALFLYDIQNILALERWRKREGRFLEHALTGSGDFDVRIAFAVYVFNHPAYVFPDIKTDRSTQLKGKDVKHPLLPAATAVGNDFVIGDTEQMYLLTGANMTGKSTFIRTIGINMLFAHLGLPVSAGSFGVTLCRVFTSMRITDSVQEDISYFKAELNRIRKLLQTIRHAGQPYLVLLDEPLRGTNSADKQSGTEAIIRKLLHEGAIGIVATHDTSLGRLEQELRGKIRNYHFESHVEGDMLQFDFRLKPGCSTTNNATLLMRQMGIV